MAYKGPRTKVCMISQAEHPNDPSRKTGYRYYTVVNPRNEKEKGHGKLERMKYDPVVRKKVLFKEGKIKK